MAEAAEVKAKLGIGKTLVDRVAKLNGNDFQYASRGDVVALIEEIERLRRVTEKRPGTITMTYQDGDHERLARAAGDALNEVERLNAALIAAERRGRIAGLRDAAEIVREWPYVQYVEGMHLEARIRTRANELEASE